MRKGGDSAYPKAAAALSVWSVENCQADNFLTAGAYDNPIVAHDAVGRPLRLTKTQVEHIGAFVVSVHIAARQLNQLANRLEISGNVLGLTVFIFAMRITLAFPRSVVNTDSLASGTRRLTGETSADHNGA